MTDKALVFKKVDYDDLEVLLGYIEMGDIGLPDIQRPFVWPPVRVRDLFDSMYQGFPVGHLVFWAPNPDAHVKHIGTDPRPHAPRLVVVDGQQRLTALYSVFRGKKVVDKRFQARSLDLAFRPSDGRFEVPGAAIEQDPEFIPSISKVFSSGMSIFNMTSDFLAQLKARRRVSQEEEDRIVRNLERLFGLRKYPFTAVEISPDVGEEQIADIFVRINSEGVTLRQADFILTLMSVFWEKGRTELEKFCRDAQTAKPGQASAFNYFIEPLPDQLLRVSVAVGFRRARLESVYSILRGKDLETGEFDTDRGKAQFEVLANAQAKVLNLDHWHEFFKVLQTAGYRGKPMISSNMGLLYCYALFLIGKHDYHVEPQPLRNLMARWFFMTALTGRYTASPESTMEQDLAGLREVTDADGFRARLDSIITDTFTSDYWNIALPNELATSSAWSPAWFAYCAALVLLDGRALFSKLTVRDLLDPGTKGKKSFIERHHLFPKAYLAKLGITERRQTNQIANYALVEWTDHTPISDRSPAEYWPQYAANFGAEEFGQMAYWHALPEGWHEMKYQEFLEARRHGMAQVIRDGFQRLSD